jgi:type 1 glutamine amidotransferase
MTWARIEGKGRVFYTAIGDRPEHWSDEFFLNRLGSGIRWVIGEPKLQLQQNLMQAAAGYAEIPPKPKAKS